MAQGAGRLGETGSPGINFIGVLCTRRAEPGRVTELRGGPWRWVPLLTPGFAPQTAGTPAPSLSAPPFLSPSPQLLIQQIRLRPGREPTLEDTVACKTGLALVLALVGLPGWRGDFPERELHTHL